MKVFSNRLKLAGLALVATAFAAGSVVAQDFTRTYRPAPGSHVSVKNVSGNITVKAGGGDSITVTGTKKGPDRDKISIEDTSNDSSVSVRARYPENCNCNASVDFEVTVPAGANFDYDWSSVSGDLEIGGGAGTIRARSVSGNVRLQAASGTINVASVSGEVFVERATGSVTAKSTSGQVKVELLRVDGTNRMEFTSVSGNVSVSMPSGVGAEIEMSTLSGSLVTDFPITVEEKRYGPGRSAKGRVGDGARVLKMSSVSGNLNLRKS